MAKGDDIENRLIDFSVLVIDLCDRLARTRAGNHLAGQLLRSGTAPAVHYAEAQGAESTADFIHKLKLCLKELNESRVWLKIVIKSKLSPKMDPKPVHQECDELCRIINASVKTTKGNP